MRHMKMVHSELFDQFQQAKEDSGIKRHKRKSNAEDGLTVKVKQEVDDNKVQAGEEQHSMGNNHSPKKRGRKSKGK